MIGKLKGWDSTEPTPAADWRQAVVDVAIPAKNEEAAIAYCLASLIQQDYPIRNITVINDGSTDGTAEVTRRFTELSGVNVCLVSHEVSRGKTPALREQCRSTDADALVILDADTVLVSRNYVSRLIEELFKNAGVASACGEVMPLTGRRKKSMLDHDPVLRAIASETPSAGAMKPGRWQRLLTYITVLYRTALYILLQRVFYDGHLKLYGSALNPVGCAVAYKTSRLRECFSYAEPRVGDNLSTSEDVYIGHFFNWKGYRNVQVSGVHCESTEPAVTRLPAQLFVWSSAFVQSLYYFKELPFSPFTRLKARVVRAIHGSSPARPDNRRRVREQYRAAWGEEVTRRDGRPIGLLELTAIAEKVTYPCVLLL